MNVAGNDDCEVDADEPALRFLVARAAQCDADAWEHLYRRSYARLFAYARRRLDSDAAADDAVSETMLRALDRIGAFTWQGGGVDAWLYGILRNVVRETYRRDNRTRTMWDMPERADPADGGPGAAIVAQEARAELRAAFELLSPDDREILELRVVAKLSAEGVAIATGSTAGAVRMAQSRALNRLRTHYEAVTGER